MSLVRRVDSGIYEVSHLPVIHIDLCLVVAGARDAVVRAPPVRAARPSIGTQPDAQQRHLYHPDANRLRSR